MIFAQKRTVSLYCCAVVAGSVGVNSGLPVIVSDDVVATEPTVTLNEQVAVLPDTSVTLYVTTVVPIGNTEPLACAEFSKVVIAPGQLSVPTGGV